VPPQPPPYAELAEEFSRREKAILDPTSLILVDEAERLKMASLEATRDIFDRGGIGLILIGMPGIEKRLARYLQLYSRIGFVHEFRPLSVAEVRRLLDESWAPPGVSLPSLDHEAVAAIIRITGGNFRLLHRLLAQAERIAQINELSAVTRRVIEAARESLVIGQL
jgi:DNA transposition AAA+ family ATPase